jgi:hypothetical protein
MASLRRVGVRDAEGIERVERRRKWSKQEEKATLLAEVNRKPPAISIAAIRASPDRREPTPCRLQLLVEGWQCPFDPPKATLPNEELNCSLVYAYCFSPVLLPLAGQPNPVLRCEEENTCQT